MVLELIVDGDTIETAARWSYNILLNEINTCEIAFDGSSEFRRTQFSTGKIVEIIKDGVLDFKGEIVGRSSFQGGGIGVRVQGLEGSTLSDDPIDNSQMTNAGLYQSVSSTIIYQEIINNGSLFSIGVVESPTVVDFKTNKSQFRWTSANKLLTTLGQDFQIDYTNNLINVRDSVGDNDVAILKENVNATGIVFEEFKAQALKVIIYGKGSGDSQILGEAQSGSYVPGNTVKIITDQTIITTTQANQRAAIELGVLEQPIKKYTFQITNINLNISIGDTITLDAPSVGVDNALTRITNIKRGMIGDVETLMVQVTNAEFSRILKARSEQILDLAQQQSDLTTSFLSGINGIAYANGYNVNDSTPLLIDFVVSVDDFESSGGNPIVDKFRYAYDIDAFRQGAGDVNLALDTDIGGNSANTQPGVNGTSASTQPSVTGSTSTSTTIINNGVDSFSENISNTGWDLVASVNYSSNYDVLYWQSIINVASGGPADLWMQIRVGGTPQITRQLHTAISGGGEFAMGDVIGRIANTSGQSAELYLRSFTNIPNCNGDFRVFSHVPSHSHSDGSLTASNHTHSDGSFIADNHDHLSGGYSVDSADFNANVSIGDLISDTGLVNASSVDIFIDYHNGTNWIQKHSILNTNLTIDSELDLSNGGTYPDAFGQWRIRMFTNNNNGDYGQGIVKLTHTQK